jgi:3D (Asp-Asp-Asp) domain-containing protein
VKIPNRSKNIASCVICALASTARAQTPTDLVPVPPLLFPVVKGADWSDTFGAARTGHTHQGQDLMAPKLRPLIACFAGTVTLHRNRGTAGNWITLMGTGAASGWKAEYMHLNNDTPGTNDGIGGDRYAFAPGLKDGDVVKAGQFLGYVGNSGNAENTGSHCHFELHGPKGAMNATLALRAARIISQVPVGLVVLPAPKPSGSLQIVGTVLTTFPEQAEVIVKVTAVKEFGGKQTELRPPRVKRLVFNGSLPTTTLSQGTLLMAEGQDRGRGRPLRVARLTIRGVETVFPDSTSLLNSEPAANSSGNTIRQSELPIPIIPALPERLVLEGFERGTYMGWRLNGDCWGRSPEPTYGGNSFRTIPGAVGRYLLSTGHPRRGDNRPATGTGVALSPEFPVTHTKLQFLIGGGYFPEECCLNLQVGGQVVRTATGSGSDRLFPVEWDISEFVGQRARLEIVDKREFGQRAYLLLDDLVLSDLPPVVIKAEPEPKLIEPVVLETSSSSPLPTGKLSADATKELVVDGVSPQAFVLLSDGTRVEGTHLMTLEATGYGPGENGQWGDRTVLGTKVGYGTVAVDPKVIPLRKHLWVEGYGFCIALDTGGAIKGLKIDLGHNSDAEAALVGHQKRRVLILD